MAIFGLMTVPLWLWGKRTRIATAKYLDLPVLYAEEFRPDGL